MTSKLPWVAAATTIVIVVGLGAWALLGQAPAGAASIGVGTSNVVFGGPEPTTSGIENVYIVDNAHAAGWNINFGDPANSENVLGVITGSGGSADISYNQYFVIVVAVKGHTDNMANVQIENMQVELAVSGSFSITQENSTNAMETVFVDGTPAYIRVNVKWDNTGAGYALPADGSISLNPINLWLWA